MTKIELAEQAVEAAKQRLVRACSDHSGPTIQQFERVWDQHGAGSVQAEQLEFVADREQARISKEFFDAKNNLAHAEMLLRVAIAEETQGTPRT